MKKLLVTAFSIGIAFALNLNTATKFELMQIKGIGPKKAEAILKYRKTHKIKSIDDLKNIKGINTLVLSNIKNDVKNKKASKRKSKIIKKLRNKKAKLISKKTAVKNKIKNSKSKLNSAKKSFKNKF